MKSKTGLPHMEWDDVNGKFEKERPKPSPTIKVGIKLMQVEHKRLGSECEFAVKGTMSAVTDTGCQTTTSGTEILKILKIPADSLLHPL